MMNGTQATRLVLRLLCIVVAEIVVIGALAAIVCGTSVAIEVECRDSFESRVKDVSTLIYTVARQDDSTEPSIETVARLLEAWDIYSRIQAINVANSLRSEVGGSDQLRPIMSIIRDVEHPSRIEAIIVMSKLDKEEIGVPEIASILNEEDPQMRSASALALGEYGEAASGYVPRLIPLLNSTAQRYQSVTLHVAESVPLRRDIAEAIGLIGKGAGAALPELRRMAQADDDGRARVAAAVAIARISGDNAIAIETIRDVLQHGRPIDQMAATFAIGPIGQDALPLMSIVIDAYQKPGGDALFVDMLASFEALGPLAKDFLPFLRELSQQSSTALDRSIISDAIRSIEGRSE